MNRLLLGCTALLLAFAFSGCATTPNPTRPSVQDANPNAWAAVLRKHVAPDGQIDFAALRQNPEELLGAAAVFGTQDASTLADPDSVLAHHINAYNALAMYHAVDSGLLPEQTVRFFAGSKVAFSGKKISLYNLENKVIRPIGEPRIHFALNCMVRDCPRLLQVPYQAAILDSQLDAATREFINDPRRVDYDPSTQTATLSKIFKWYRKDFGPDLLAYINQYRDQAIPPEAEIEWFEYDWSLNQS